MYGDGALLWRSADVKVKGKTESAEIKLLDVNLLHLRVVDLNTKEPGGGAVTKGSHAVFSVANIEFQTMYRRWYR